MCGRGANAPVAAKCGTPSTPGRAVAAGAAVVRVMKATTGRSLTAACAAGAATGPERNLTFSRGASAAGAVWPGTPGRRDIAPSADSFAPIAKGLRKSKAKALRMTVFIPSMARSSRSAKTAARFSPNCGGNRGCRGPKGLLFPVFLSPSSHVAVVK